MLSAELSNHDRYVRDKERYELEHGPGTYDDYLASQDGVEVIRMCFACISRFTKYPICIRSIHLLFYHFAAPSIFVSPHVFRQADYDWLKNEDGHSDYFHDDADIGRQTRNTHLHPHIRSDAMSKRIAEEERVEAEIEAKLAEGLSKPQEVRDHFHETVEEQRKAFFTDLRDEPYHGVVRIKKHLDVMEKVHYEHDKVQAVVDALNEKVQVMKEKQKKEYIEAYAKHMEDLQVELIRLRELVAEIANDKTKQNKIQELKDDEVFYKAEAVRLDALCVNWRKRIKDFTYKIHRVERERDWLLAQLRKQKNKYNHLKSRMKKVSTTRNNDDESIFSSDSQLSFEIARGRVRGGEVANRRNGSNYDTSNSRSRKSSASKVDANAASSSVNTSNDISVGQQNQTPLQRMNYEGFYGVSEALMQGEYDDDEEFKLPGEEHDDYGGTYDYKNLTRFNSAPQIGHSGRKGGSIDERARTAGGTLIRKKSKVLNSLVKNRMKIESMKSLVNEALDSTLNGAWSKFTHCERTPDEVLEDCERVQKDIIDFEGRERRVPSNLVAELAAFPEVYQVVLSMIGADAEEKLADIKEAVSPIRIDESITNKTLTTPVDDLDGYENNIINSEGMKMITSTGFSS